MSTEPTPTGPQEPEGGRTGLLGIIGGLMVADNLGDVHDEIMFLCDLAGIPRPDGNFIDGWTEEDFAHVGIEAGDDA